MRRKAGRDDQMTDSTSKHLFSADRPIASRKEDLLGRSGFAESLAAAIKGWKGNDSLVIAIYGPWGSGKSSVKNMVLESLRESEKDCPLIVEFNPWQWAGQEQLAEAFFQEIGVALGRSDTSEKGKERAAKWRTYGTYLTLGASLAKSLKTVLPLLGIPGSSILGALAKGLEQSSKVAQEGSEALDAQATAIDHNLSDVKQDLSKPSSVLLMSVAFSALPLIGSKPTKRKLTYNMPCHSLRRFLTSEMGYLTSRRDFSPLVRICTLQESPTGT